MARSSRNFVAASLSVATSPSARMRREPMCLNPVEDLEERFTPIVNAYR
jgi:hypothetical protein